MTGMGHEDPFPGRRLRVSFGSGAVKLIGFHRILGCALNHNHQMTMGRGRHPRWNRQRACRTRVALWCQFL